MRIGIDMRMAGTGEGIARYCEELVNHMAQIDRENEYYLISNDRASVKLKVQSEKFVIVEVRSKYYSLAEQTRFIWELKRLKLDLVHFTSFNAPVFYPGKFVVTIHDIIHHLYPGKKKARLLHRLAYRLVIKSAVSRAAKIIAVSQSTKDDIVKTFHTDPKKIAVVYEGVDERFFTRLAADEIEPVLARYNIRKPYLLFVGVWRQYKNLPRLAQAFDIIKDKYGKDCRLVIAGKIDPFYPEIKKSVFVAKNAKDIIATGYIPDDHLPELYQGASAFVLPSLVEGFGLIGAEAQASGIPVAASDIPVLREVLGSGALYFNPRDPEDMAEKINEVLTVGTSKNENARKYSWAEAAKKTLEIYEGKY